MHNDFNPTNFEPKHVGSAHVLFQIGNYNFHTYSLTMMMGMIAAILTVAYFWKREKYSFEILLTMIILTIPFSFIGARLWFITEKLIYYRDSFDFSRWYAIWDGGLAIQGGVMMAFVVNAIYLSTKTYEVDLIKVFTIIFPSVFIGQVIGRFGNYANHEIYGNIDWTGNSALWMGEGAASNMFLADELSNNLNVSGAFRHPLFIYEAGLTLLGYIVLAWLCNGMNLLKPGSTGALYFVWYGAVRMIMEPYRIHGYGIYQITSALFLVFGMIAFVTFEFILDLYDRIWIKEKNRFEMVRKNKKVKPENYHNWMQRLFRIYPKQTAETNQNN
ncbi:Prolipoprotein diacylglyceryl transferase [Mycoplasmopsis californica]|uniref:Phosphatidylglycerol--prolipoprotein diacylglyceryl transferase n=1 Tax=Mycoplasmopsis equigenitalium TaxID=114883 RepID=A0ABY5J5H5_9BACT|nr:prolipoprotein diacylglyceryl transferase [Mycoplasmopsis equigenitalium]UUD37131.1 prolipoprotein diacylglyceryl transferase [Mycoplasmopsis equigenitalium]VEU69563.1 Prolipoprotein diacylglyceryl transferase [Mycoplasmopsis californica]